MEKLHVADDFGRIGLMRPEWLVIQEGSGMIGKSIGEIASLMRHEIVGLRRGKVDRLQPDGEVVAAGDQLLVMSDRSPTAPANKTPAEPKKIVIVDDNPVIVRLYASLFQQAGFLPFTADSGDSGLALIFKEQPTAAVVDFMLPKISGLEVCRRVRQAFPDKSVKLVVFTADDTRQLRENCLQAGADEVVVKSAELDEIVDVVAGLVAR